MIPVAFRSCGGRRSGAGRDAVARAVASRGGEARIPSLIACHARQSLVWCGFPGFRVNHCDYLLDV
jgi:hypothetical protein